MRRGNPLRGAIFSRGCADDIRKCKEFNRVAEDDLTAIDRHCGVSRRRRWERDVHIRYDGPHAGVRNVRDRDVRDGRWRRDGHVIRLAGRTQCTDGTEGEIRATSQLLAVFIVNAHGASRVRLERHGVICERVREPMNVRSRSKTCRCIQALRRCRDNRTRTGQWLGRRPAFANSRKDFRDLYRGAVEFFARRFGAHPQIHIARGRRRRHGDRIEVRAAIARYFQRVARIANVQDFHIEVALRNRRIRVLHVDFEDARGRLFIEFDHGIHAVNIAIGCSVVARHGTWFAPRGPHIERVDARREAPRMRQSGHGRWGVIAAG